MANILGLSSVDVHNYSQTPHDGELERQLAKYMDSVTHDLMLPGDWFTMRTKRWPQHMALYTGDTMIHASASDGKVVEHGFHTAHRRLIITVYRYRVPEGETL